MNVMRGEVYYADLSPVIGSEQGGYRPVLVVQNNKGNKYSTTVIVAPVSSKIMKNPLPTHVLIELDGLQKKSVVLLEHLRPIDKKRIKEREGKVSDVLMYQINEAMKTSLDIF